MARVPLNDNHESEESQRTTLGREPGVCSFVPPVDRDAVFTTLICDELRRGRLTKAKRERIVRYACGMGLGARRAGELVRECIESVAAEDGDQVKAQALRLAAEPAPLNLLSPFVIFGIGATAIAVAYQMWQKFF